MPRNSLPPERVLLYGVEDPALPELLSAHEMPYRIVLPEELDETVGHLSGFPGFPAAGTSEALPEPPLPSTLVMAGFSSARMDELLAALRTGGHRITLKATVTVTNQFWPLRKLIGELSRERAALAARRRSHRKK